MKPFLSSHRVRIALLAFLLPGTAFSANAIKTWDYITNGGVATANNNFFQAQNWNLDTRPDFLPGGNNDQLVFAGAGTGVTIPLNVNGTQTAYEIKSWAFTAGTYTFNNTQNVTLGDTTSLTTNTGILSNSGTGTITFNNTSVIGFRFGAIDASGGPIIFGTGPTLNIGFGLTGATNNVTVRGAANVTVGGVLAGAGTDSSPGGVLIKEGTNTLFLNGASATWNGRVAINNGVVRISKSTSLGSSVGSTSIAGGTNNGRLELLGNLGLTEPLHLAGRSVANTADQIRNLSDNNLLSGPLSLDAGGTEYTFQSDAGSLTVASNIVYGTASGSTTVHLQGAGNGVVAGNVGAGGSAIGVLKDGTGTWSLTGASDYNGPTTILAGQLNLSTALTGTGALAVSDGATLGLTLTAAGQSFAPSAIALGSVTGGTVNLDLGSFGSNPTVPMINSGAVTVNGTNTINVKAGGLSVGQVPLIRYTSLGGAGISGLALGSLPARVSATLVDDSAHSQVALNVTLFDFPRWTGAVDGNWDINDGTSTGTANWREFNSGLVTRYLQGAGGTDGVLFDDTAVGASTINLTSTLTPTSVKVVNQVLSYTFSGTGKLSGNATLTKDGPGTLVLSNTGINDYAGTTTITNGVLQVGDGLLAGGGSLGSGPVVNNASLVINRPDNYTLGAAISGTGTLTVQGAGVTTLSGTSTFSGPVNVTAGILKLGNGNALGSTAAGTSVQAGGTLDFGGQLVPLGEVVSIAGAGSSGAGALVNTGTGGAGAGLKNLVLTGPAALGGSTRWDVRDNEGGVNANGFDLTKTGTNAVRFANVGETNIGNLDINGAASSLVFEGDSTLGANTGVITVETGAVLGFASSTATHAKRVNLQAGTLSVLSGTTNVVGSTISIDTVGTVDVAKSSQLLLSGKITGGGNLIKTTAGTLVITGDGNDYAGVTQISAGTLQLGNDGPTGSLAPGDLIDNGTLALRRTDTALNIASNISGTGAITVGLTGVAAGSSSVATLSGNNSFTGGVTVTSGGLRITNSNALGTGPKVVAVQNALHPQLRLEAVGGDISLDPSISFNTSSDDPVQSAIINEAGNNTIAGGINLRNGGGGNTRIRVDAGSLALTGAITAAPDATSARTLILDGVGTASHIDGVLANGVGNPSATPPVAPQNLLLTKAGAGTWTLNAANTYTGATSVQGGVLALGPVASIATTATIDIAAGATLDASAGPGVTLASQTLTGSGTIIGATTLGAAAVISPGTITTTGTLAVVGTFTLGGGTLQTNVSLPLLTAPATGDLVSVTGDVAITAASKIQVLPTGAVLTGSYPLINYTGKLTGDTGTLTIVNPTRATVAVDASTPGQINLVFGGSGASLVWAGNGTTNTWDTTTAKNWNAGTDHFFPVDAVRFDDTAAAANTTVTVTGTLYPSSVTVDATQNYTFGGTGVIAGVGSLTKSGTGTLTINNIGSYSGKTQVGGGTLLLGATGKLTNTRWIQVDQGAAFDVSAVTGGFTLGGLTDERVLSGLGTLNGTFIVNGAGVLSPGPSSDSADIAKAGDGVGELAFANDLTLSGAALAGSPRAVLQLSGATGRVADPSDTTGIVAFDKTVPTTHDYLAVGGTLHLDAGSTIKVVLTPGYTPQFGDVYNLIDWQSVDLNADATGGSFDPVADLDLPALPEGLGWNRDYFTTYGLLVVGLSAPEVGAISFSPSSTVNPGDVVTLSVVVVSPADVTYQWKRNNVAIQGGIKATLVLNAAESDQASYSVTVTNVAGSTTSLQASLIVNDPVTIVSPPQPWTGNPGDTATFSVSAAGTGPFTYQWRKNQVAINGETGATLSLAAVTASDEGIYDVVVTNVAGSTTTTAVPLTVNRPAAVTTDPASQVVIPGTAVVFNVGVSGTSPFTYQWRKDSHAIQGATSASYSIASVTADDQGTYDVVITNSVNSTISNGAALQVIAGTVPQITVQPVSKLVALGATVSLSVTAVAKPPVKFQWLKNNAPVAGATSSTFALSSAQLANAGAYSVKVTSVSTTTSNVVQLGVVDTSSKALPVAAGASAVVTLSTAGNNQSFVWTKNGGALPVDLRIKLSADKKTITLTGLTTDDNGAYQATVTGPGGSIQGGQTQLKAYTGAPVILTPVVFPSAAVSAPFGGSSGFQILVDTAPEKAPTAFAATGLPSGLTLDTRTGIISGKPVLASTTKPFSVLLTASNAKGKSTVTVPLVVTSLPAGAVGTFTGLVVRDAGLNDGLGGRLDLTILATGAFSGKLVLGANTLSFAGVLDASTTSVNPSAKVSVARTGRPPLTLAFTIDTTSGYLTSASITDGSVVLALNAWRNTWLAKGHSPSFAGYYTLGFEIPAAVQSSLSIPQGQGYASFTVTAAGTLALAGKLSDGSAIVENTFAGPAGEIAVFQPLYGSKGSIAGSLTIVTGTGPVYNDSTLGGTVSWFGPAVPGRTYANGFGPLDLTSVGGRYVAPAGNGLFLGLQDQDNNVRLVFSEARISTTSTSPDLTLSIRAGEKIKLPVLNPAKTTLTIVPATGVFSGLFTLSDPNPLLPKSPYVRSNIAYQGLVIRTASGLEGFGYYLLPQLPTALPPQIPALTLSSTPILSGQVVLESTAP